jgi:two-component system chemotaxis sensor kinase CheA
MDDLLSEFLTETNESLATLDLELVRLEQNPNDPGLLGNIFRIVHTIKGTCGFLGLPRLEAVAHASENVLGKFRDGEQQVTAQAVSLILASLDQIKSLLAQLEANEAEPAGEDSELIARLNALAAGELSPAAAPAPAKPAAPAPKAEAKPAAPEPVLAKPIVEPEPAAAPAPAPAEPEIAEAKVEAKAKEPKPAKDAAKEPRGEVTETKESAVAAQSIRVNVDLLENLMTMVSELVLTRNQLMQILRGQKDSEFGAPLQRLSHVTTELQEGVMKTRMQPIGNAWAKLPRIVRDLSH